MDPAYYKAYAYLERSHWWFRARNRLLMEEVAREIEKRSLRRPSILNVGCGTGRTSELLSSLGEVDSIEYDSECAQWAANTTGLPVYQGDVTQLLEESASYDIVCAFDVIEHVQDDHQAVSELHRVCRPGGAVVISVPAGPWLWSEHDEVNHHYRRYTRGTLEEALGAAPWESVDRLTYFNFLLLPLVAGFRTLRAVSGRRAAGGEGQAPDFEAGSSGWMSRALETILFSENRLLQRGLVFPGGVSLLATLRP